MANAQRNALVFALGVNDIYKAYDHVNSNLLKEYLNRTNVPNRNVFISTLSDYDKCNLRIGNTIIKRTMGLPQGAKGSPQLFNYYLCQTAMKEIKHEFIYADNIIFREANMANLTKQEELFGSAIRDGGMRFDNPSVNATYARSEIVDKRNKPQLGIPLPKPERDVIVPMKTQRILGYKVMIDETGTLKFDVEDIINNISTKVRMLPPYMAMKYFKVFIKPKILFHFKHLNQLPQLRDIFQANTCIVCLPYAYLDMNKVFDPGTANPWHKYWSIYCMVKNGDIKLPARSDHKRLKRWRILCVLMNKYYISIYKAIKFINTGTMILKSSPNNLSYQEFKNNAKILDIAWFCIMRGYRESKMMLVMEQVFMERLLKVGKPCKKSMKNINLKNMEKNIKKWLKRN